LPRIGNKDKCIMDEELSRLHTLYTKLICCGTADKPQDALDSNRRFSKQLWGSPLSLTEFQDRWSRICLDPELKKYWIKRLEAVSDPTTKVGDQDVAA
jgi:hypothetical protein